MTRATDERPSTTSLIGDAIRQATELFTTEIALVRLEATEKLGLALASVASLFVAAVLMIVAMIFLLQGLVQLLVHIGLAPFVASFAVGGGIGLVALIAVVVAVRNLSLARLKPTRVLGQIDHAKSITGKSSVGRSSAGVTLAKGRRS